MLETVGHSPSAPKVNEFHVVYYVSPKTGKKIALQAYEDVGLAKSHLQEFKNLYGKLVQAGIEQEVTGVNATMAMQGWSRGTRNYARMLKRKGES